MNRPVSKNVVMLSTADWDNPFWTNKQFMALEFAKQGHDVLYVESIGLRKPDASSKKDRSRILKRLIKFFQGLRPADYQNRTNEVVPGKIRVFSPLLIPLHRYSIVQAFNRKFFGFQIFLAINLMGFLDYIIWTYHPLIEGVRSLIKNNQLYYHAVDDLSASPGIDRDLINQKEKELLPLAKRVFVTSLTLEKRFESFGFQNVQYDSNVVDFKHFNKAWTEDLDVPLDIAEIQGPIAGFIGALSPYKVRFDDIESAAKNLPHWTFVLIGREGEGQPGHYLEQVLKESNVIHLGPKNYEDLPAYLKRFQVSLIPSPLNDYTKSMFPMKFFESLASGTPVIATDLPALAPYQKVHFRYSDASDLVHKLQEIESSIEGTAGNIAIRFKESSILEEMVRSGIEIGSQHTWSHRFEKIISSINE